MQDADAPDGRGGSTLGISILAGGDNPCVTCAPTPTPVCRVRRFRRVLTSIPVTVPVNHGIPWGKNSPTSHRQPPMHATFAQSCRTVFCGQSLRVEQQVEPNFQFYWWRGGLVVPASRIAPQVKTLPRTTGGFVLAWRPEPPLLKGPWCRYPALLRVSR